VCASYWRTLLRVDAHLVILTVTTKEEILSTVRGILVGEFELDPHAIQLDTHLVDGLDLDSIDAIDLAVRLEEKSGHALEEDELKAFVTVGDVVELVYAKVTCAPNP
jgi:acyl carrier protein